MAKYTNKALSVRARKVFMKHPEKIPKEYADIDYLNDKEMNTLAKQHDLTLEDFENFIFYLRNLYERNDNDNNSKTRSA